MPTAEAPPAYDVLFRDAAGQSRGGGWGGIFGLWDYCCTLGGRTSSNRLQGENQPRGWKDKAFNVLKVAFLTGQLHVCMYVCIYVRAYVCVVVSMFFTGKLCVRACVCVWCFCMHTNTKTPIYIHTHTCAVCILCSFSSICSGVLDGIYCSSWVSSDNDHCW